MNLAHAHNFRHFEFLLVPFCSSLKPVQWTFVISIRNLRFFTLASNNGVHNFIKREVSREKLFATTDDDRQTTDETAFQYSRLWVKKQSEKLKHYQGERILQELETDTNYDDRSMKAFRAIGRKSKMKTRTYSTCKQHIYSIFIKKTVTNDNKSILQKHIIYQYHKIKTWGQENRSQIQHFPYPFTQKPKTYRDTLTVGDDNNLFGMSMISPLKLLKLSTITITRDKWRRVPSITNINILIASIRRIRNKYFIFWLKKRVNSK